MRKLIETIRKSLIVCDNLQCDYELPYSEEEEKLIVKYAKKNLKLLKEKLIMVKNIAQLNVNTKAVEF